MSENDQPQQQNESATDGVEQPDSVDTEAQAEGTATADETAQAESSAPQAEADDEVARLKDQVLRSLAEVENIKRRSARDVENAHKFAVEKLLSDLLPVIDSLEKAVETASATEGAEPIAEGVELSLKLFIDTLAKSGVEQIDPLGAPFDPQEHEAMTMVPNPDAEPNSVMDVMAKGYRLNGRLVRAAKVIVVKAD
ncbi:MAG: nucleotide exchange factor GrpE [Pseudomonadales bacterium]